MHTYARDMRNSFEGLSEKFDPFLCVLYEVNNKKKLFEVMSVAFCGAYTAPKLLYNIYQSSVFQKFTRTFGHIDLY